jgi:NAD(P)-dependent dehydrogenase (short-subunit alcohol dehydrogenase family)
MSSPIIPRVALATGGGAGVGVPLAQALLAAGCRFVANYGHDERSTEAGFINAITLSINGREYLS